MAMKFEDQLAICKAAEEGKKIEYYDTFASMWVEVKDEKNCLFNFRNQTYRIKSGEPKVLHQYLIRDRNGDFFPTYQFFESIEDCKKKLPLVTVISVLPHTRIEIFEQKGSNNETNWIYNHRTDDAHFYHFLFYFLAGESLEIHEL